MSKIPYPEFNTDDEFEDYLKSLTHPVLKKVARIVNKIMRNSKFDVSQSQKDLLAEMLRRFNYDDNKDFFDVPVFIEKGDLPRPSMNLKKPTKKQLKEAQKTVSLPVEKDIGVLIKEYIDTEKLKASSDPVFFTCYDWIFPLCIAYILRKHTNDCALITGTGDTKGLFELLLGDSVSNKGYTINYKNKIDIENVAKRYVKCKNNGKILVIPLRPMIGHQNVLFLNGYLNTAERYEPHGDKTYGRGDYKKMDLKTTKQLETFIESVNKLLLDADKLKLVPMIEICPSQKGIQSYETKSKELRAQRKKVLAPFGEVLFKDPGGYCCAWSLLMIDLRLRFPKETLQGVNDIMMANLVSKTDPIQKDLFYFIRGFMSFVFLEIQKVLEKIPDVLDNTATISDVWDVLMYNKKSLAAKGKSNLLYKYRTYGTWFQAISIDDLWTKGILT